MSTTHAAELAASLTAAGYEQAPPPWLHSECADIDREVCEDTDCPNCGRSVLAWRPWHNVRARSYVAVALCLLCGYAEEF